NEIDEPGGRFRREVRDAALELLEPLEDIVERVETAEEPTNAKLDVLAHQACRQEGDKQRYVRRHPVASSGRMLSVEGTGEWLCLRRQDDDRRRSGLIPLHAASLPLRSIRGENPRAMDRPSDL